MRTDELMKCHDDILTRTCKNSSTALEIEQQDKLMVLVRDL